MQESTRESPFCLLYGRYPRIPTETVLSKPVSPSLVDVEDYRCDLVSRMSSAWSLARDRIEHTQEAQKFQYDRHAKEPDLRVGVVHMPGEVKGKSWKLVRPFHGPYRVVSVTPNNVEVVLVDRPEESSVFVSLNRCFEELEDVSWTGPRKKRARVQVKSKASTRVTVPTRQGPVTRSMTLV